MTGDTSRRSFGTIESKHGSCSSSCSSSSSSSSGDSSGGEEMSTFTSYIYTVSLIRRISLQVIRAGSYKGGVVEWRWWLQ